VSPAFGLAAVGLVLLFGGILLGLSLIVLLGFATLIFTFSLWVAAGLAIFRNSTIAPGEKAVWFVFVTLVPTVGPIGYLVAKPRRQTKF
jgi:hypothetical protein